MKTWHRDPVFQKLEYHDDYEKFVFLSGNALFPVADTRMVLSVPGVSGYLG